MQKALKKLGKPSSSSSSSNSKSGGRNKSGHNKDDDDDVVIPTPKVTTVDMKTYEKFYKIDTFIKPPKLYIKEPSSSSLNNNNNNDYPDYDADAEDERWLKEKRAQLPKDFSDDLTLYFECIMDRLEKITAHSTNVTKITMT